MSKMMDWQPLPKKKQHNHPYAHFIHQVQKPARYMGGEFHSVRKEWEQMTSNMVLCFPDVYDIGMSHLGTKILYNIINKTEDLALERVFCPWFDMEAELRKQELPLLSLENHRPLSDFDIVGFSLQYEMTFTNIFTMLELGNIPLHNKDRTLDDPLIIAGGPVATQPEPMSSFIDVFLVGDAEERLPSLMRHYAQLKKQTNLTRLEVLAELAKKGGLYCPELYEREICPDSGLMVVEKPLFDGVPDFVERAFLDDISRYKFPDDSPVAVAEAIFDRMSIEISRGCTEGCRFCQAGMIYRPVRERDPEEVVETLMSALDKGGFDEASITSLSTADYSCVSPLIKNLMEKLRPRKTSLGISSLRAYGLSEDLLDEIDTVKATGLTFAPEAGTQRMRDVVNKNVTEEDIKTTCHRVFSRGWNKMKLYFMIGLPTEEEDDVIGIAKMGKMAYEVGRQYKKNVRVVVSVSSHVPKPHTPFQWCRMDRMDEIYEKQEMLFKLSKKWGYRFRKHDMRISHLEGILARGDRRVSHLLLDVWKKGARFDGWDEHLKWDLWMESLENWEKEQGITRDIFLDTLPVDARLPWDHIDMGLDEGFLKLEYQKSLKNRLSPPCGKPKGAQVHHTNVEEANEDERKLVCYHCGIACDMTNMKQERVDFLTKLDAIKPVVYEKPTNQLREQAEKRVKKGLTPHSFNQGKAYRYRVKYAKMSPVNMQGHQDLLRIIPRVFRRSKLNMYFSEGFSPKPVMSFGPALSLGILATSEYFDISLLDQVESPDVLQRLRENAPNGLEFLEVRALSDQEKGLSKMIQAVDYACVLPENLRSELSTTHKATTTQSLVQAINQVITDALAQDELNITITRKHKTRTLDAKQQLLQFDAKEIDVEEGSEDSNILISMRSILPNGPSIRPLEIIESVLGISLDYHNLIRTNCWHINKKGDVVDPMHT